MTWNSLQQQQVFEKARHAVLTLLDKFCPSLIQFYMVECEYLLHYPGLCFTSPSTRNIIAIADMPYLEDELTPLLARCRPPLEILRLDLSSTIKAHQVLASIVSVQGFPQLREIDLTGKLKSREGIQSLTMILILTNTKNPRATTKLKTLSLDWTVRA